MKLHIITATLKHWRGIAATICCTITFCLVFVSYARAQEAALYPLKRGSIKGGDQKYGFVDGTGHFVIPPQFDEANAFVNGRAQIKIGQKFGFINERGEQIVPAIYDYATDYSEGFAAVASGEKRRYKQWRVIDRDGRVIVGPKYGWAGRIHDGLIVVGTPPNPRQATRLGAIDTTGRLVIDMVYESLEAFSEGLALVKINGKYGFISKTGELTIPAIYQYAHSFINGLAIVTVKDVHGRLKQGVIDVHGRYVVQPEYDVIQEFQDGRAIAIDTSFPEKFHLIDRSGKRLMTNIDPKTICDRNPHYQLHADNLRVLKSADGKCFYADANGHNRFEREFELAWPFMNGLAVVWVSAQEAFGGKSSNRKFAGVINETGAFVVPPIFDEVWIDTPAVIKIRWRDQREDYLDRAGKPLTFDEAEVARYRDDMRAYFAPIKRDPSRTIAARAADGDYYLSLPKGFCVLDKTKDARIFEKVGNQISAVTRDKAQDNKDERPVMGAAGAGKRSEPTGQPANSGLFASCDELVEYRATGDLLKLSRLGTAMGYRQGRRDPTGYAGIVVASKMFCGMLRGQGGGRHQPQTELQRRERIAKSWRIAASGKVTRLMAIDEQPFACTSVLLAPDDHGAIVANIFTQAFVPNWSVRISKRAAPNSENELIEFLRRERETVNAFTREAIETAAAEAR